MKKIFLTSLFFMPCFAFADDVAGTSGADSWKYYIALNGEAFVSDVAIKDDTFLDMGAALGVEFGAQYNRARVAVAFQDRGEASGIFQALVGHTASIENISLRVNGYYDYVSKERFAMYVGAGLGANRYDYKIQQRYPNREESEHGLSFIGGVSTGMIFSGEHFGVDVGFAVDYISFPRIYSYGPTLGLRYKF